MTSRGRPIRIREGRGGPLEQAKFQRGFPRFHAPAGQPVDGMPCAMPDWGLIFRVSSLGYGEGKGKIWVEVVGEERGWRP